VVEQHQARGRQLDAAAFDAHLGTPHYAAFDAESVVVFTQARGELPEAS